MFFFYIHISNSCVGSCKKWLNSEILTRKAIGKNCMILRYKKTFKKSKLTPNDGHKQVIR